MLLVFCFATFSTMSYADKLTVTIIGDGTINGTVDDEETLIKNCTTNSTASCSGNFEAGKSAVEILLTATSSVTPSWSGDVPNNCSTSKECTIKIDGTGDKNVTVNFNSTSIQQKNKLTVNSPTNGTITSNDSKISCGNQCSAEYEGTTTSVTLTATPADNYEFTSWTGCTSSSNTCSVTMSENKTVSATFTEKQSEKATISLSADGLTNNDTLDFGDVETEQSKPIPVTISSDNPLQSMSVAVSGNTFSNSCSSNVCTVTFKPTISGTVTGTLKITADNADAKTITLKGNGKEIEVEQKSFTLTTTSEPNNGGSIQCAGNACESSYSESSEITLSAKANEGFTFEGFNGDCSGNTCTLTFGENKSVTATFKANPTTENPPDEPANPPTTYTLTVTKPVNGTITGSGLECGTKGNICSASIGKNTSVTLKAEPDENFEITSWNGCFSNSTDNTRCEVNITSNDVTLSVSFKRKAEDTTNDNIPTTYKLTISPLSNGKLLCDDQPCVSSSEYPKGTEITLKAEANEGFLLESWINDAISCVDTSNSCTLTMDADKTIGATFKQDATPEATAYKLTINSLSNGKLLCNDAPCDSEYSKDTEITLKAEANEGFLLESWINDAISCVDTSDSCTLLMDDNKTIGVTFKKVITENPSCDGELVNDVCISVPSGFSKKSVLGFDQNGNAVTLTTQFYGSINGESVDAPVALSNGNSVEIKGMVVPDSKHKNRSADIIVVGLYTTESDKLQADCDPANGHFYMNTAGFTNKYCNWIVNGRPDECNDRNLRDRPTTVNDFWTRWNGHMDSLKPMYTGVTLDETGVNQVLYEDTIGNYQGQVCLYFGYRLEGTLVFNSDPIVFSAQ